MYRRLIIAFSIINICSYAYAGINENKLAKEVQVRFDAGTISMVNQHMTKGYQAKQQAWINDMSQRMKKWVPNQLVRERLLGIIQYEAVRSGLDPQLVLSIITVESRFNKYAISEAGALGFMQVMPFWPKKIGTGGQNLLDTQTNIRYGCTILKYYLDMEHGNLYNALGRYNGSRGNSKYPTLVLSAYHQYWQT